MVYYIRFLKSPKLDLQKGTVRALVTITTDLGDDFYPASVTLHATIITMGCAFGWQSNWQTVQWKNGIRNVWIDFRGIKPSSPGLLQLIVSTRPTLAATHAMWDNLPEIFCVRSDSFGQGKGPTNYQAEDTVERRYRSAAGQERVIYEETGESIARHIWDAGFVLATYLSHAISKPDMGSSISKALSQAMALDPKIIELGSGCGIVGLEVAQTCLTSEVLLTDLPETMPILNHNVDKAGLVSEKDRVATAILDWDHPFPTQVLKAQYDMVIVSDCTYNSDSIPALVATLVALTEISPTALVVISMKVRHDSEAIFFDLMTEGGFAEIERISVLLPDRQRQITGQSLEIVDMYAYSKIASLQHD